MVLQRSRHRKYIAFLGLATAATTLAGCAGGGGGGEASEGPADSITVATVKAPGYADCINSVKDAFTEETGTKVELVELPYAGMFDKYQAGFQSGNAPYDLIGIPFQWTGQFADQGAIAEVEAPDDVLESVNGQYTYAGTQYGIPYNSGLMGFYYRTDLLEQMGYDKFPDTTEGIVELEEKIKADPTLSGQGIFPTSVMGDQTQLMALFNTLYHGLGGPAFEKEDGTVNDIDVDAAAATFDTIQQMVDLSPAGALTATFATVPAQFFDGTVAVIPMFSTSMPGPTLESSSIAGNYAFAAAPGGGDLAGWGWVVDAASEKQQSAQDFAHFLADPKNEIPCVEQFGRSPITTEAYQNEEVIATNPVTPQIEAALADGQKRFTGPQAQGLNETVNAITSQFLAGQLGDSDAAAQKLADEIQTVAGN
ncbi:extracellular solute-binding protein [Microbacterium trichothecenolyticum]|uniref:extracellular solute-binding protein n=1 Tax=Microbacterium trichothecenolyticum TaxID=69370 RepID=UPI001C6E4D5D|nr:extracellular solute-binding protein [Microbacterium trichothecenolyticum]MBW9122331.1 extracellular solute-binding protein [Microbacterium trichothecenolyticum]